MWRLHAECALEKDIQQTKAQRESYLRNINIFEVKLCLCLQMVRLSSMKNQEN